MQKVVTKGLAIKYKRTTNTPQPRRSAYLVWLTYNLLVDEQAKHA